jgi:hypothetical protein
MIATVALRFPVLATLGAIAALAAFSVDRLRGDDPDPVEQLTKHWEKEVRTRLEKDDKLKTALKHPLVILHSRALYAQGDYKRSAFSFIHESADETKHGNDVQLLFHNGGTPNTFVVNMVVGQQNLIVDLGKTDFAKDPDPAAINIDDRRVVGGAAHAREGHVYLERVRDGRGNSFYVLFQIVAVDRESRYMGFIWRKLPGGTVTKQKGGKRIG